MPDRDPDAPGRQVRHVGRSLGPVRRKRHEPDQVAARLLPGRELGEARRADVRGRMCSARPVLRIEVWPFDMHEGRRVAKNGVCVARGRDGLE